MPKALDRSTDLLDLILSSAGEGIYGLDEKGLTTFVNPAAAAMLGARGGVDVPENDRALVIRHLERYYAKLDMPSPFEDDDKQYFSEAEAKKLTARELEKALRKGVAFSKAAAKYVVGAAKLDETPSTGDNEALGKLIQSIRDIKLA